MELLTQTQVGQDWLKVIVLVCVSQPVNLTGLADDQNNSLTPWALVTFHFHRIPSKIYSGK